MHHMNKIKTNETKSTSDKLEFDFGAKHWLVREECNSWSCHFTFLALAALVHTLRLLETGHTFTQP